MENKFTPPEQVVKNYAEEKKKKLEEYQKEHRLKEGTYDGRIIKISDELSRPPKSNPMWVMVIRTTGNTGKPVDEKKVFVKHLDFHMAEFWGIFKKAGFDLKAITSEEKVGDAVNLMVENLPKIKFVCKHQKDSNYNDYEITEIERIVDGPAESAEEPVSGAKTSSESTGLDYTVEDVEDFDKQDCLDVAEELGITLQGKTKGKMVAELQEYIRNYGKDSEAEAESEEDSSLNFSVEDVKNFSKEECLEVAKSLGITLSSKILNKMRSQLIEEMGDESEPEKAKPKTEKAKPKTEAVEEAEEVEEAEDDPFPEAD